MFVSESKNSKKQNRLAKEKSPYLLQHADNPVDWYPWGEEAFEKARKENKPILLSIGYSTCHWCHVMEHESFEDPEVAKLMNETFVSIKVDREERPDIDNIYMSVCQMLTGSGGWPLTIFLTPDKQPFFAATYIPKDQRFGRAGMMQLIPRIKEIWEQQKNEVLHSATEITKALRQTEQDSSGDLLGERALKVAYEQLSQRYDRTFGGFGDQPKFPTPHQYLFLLRYWKRTGDSKALEMVEKTLPAMRRGGIYDHLGFGFHRYSTDREWLVPHFEKMLYDQALLAMAYTETYQATGNEEYAKVAREIFTYVLRDMTSPAGGFYSAEDADSEGEEGKFYVWTAEEIRNVLGNEEAETILEIFQVDENGNFIEQVAGHRTGHNILHLGKPISEPELETRLEVARKKLFDYREKRVHPYKDDKILTDWNGLMIAALAQAARTFEDPSYAGVAKRSAQFLLGNLRKPDGELMHRYRDGEGALPAHLDDYAFLIWGLLDLYEATFDLQYFRTALQLNDYVTKHFWDSAKGAFFFTSDQGEDLLVRTKEIYDGAIPSGNSVAMLNLLRLSRMTGDTSLEKRAEQIERAFSKNVSQIPSGHTQLMVAVNFRVGPSYEVVIAGDSDAEDTRAMLHALNKRYLPSKVVILRPTEEETPGIAQLAAFTKYQSSLQGKATAYVCQNFVCNTPTTDVDKMLDLLKR